MGNTQRLGNLVNGLTVDANGNVGINTSAPAYRLDVTGTGRFTGNVILSGGNLGVYITNPTSPLHIGASTSGNQKLVQFGEPGYADNYGLILRGSSVDGVFKFYGLNNSVETTNPILSMNRATGNVGIGTSSPLTLLDVKQSATGTATVNVAFRDSSTNGNALQIWNGNNESRFRAVYYGTPSDQNITFYTITSAGSEGERMRITGSGNVGIGTTSPNGTLEVYAATPTIISGASSSGSFHGLEFRQNNTVDAYIKQLPSTGEMKFSVGRNSSWGGNMTFFTDTLERMRITSAGYVYLGPGYGASCHRINIAVPQASPVLTVSGYNGSNNDTAIFYGVNGASGNAAATAIWVTTNSSTGRSINAGGTVNTGGSDYAEYIEKAVTDNINKGDIVGIDINAKVTNIFADAISFAVKSTNPSYVGGDLWAESIGKRPLKTTDQTEEEFAPILAEFEIKLEEARSKVDRIAFSGQVPCNVYNAQVGDYIIPINNNGKISGQAVTNPTFEQYQISIGKVWKIMEDGRAWVAVKIG